MVDGSPIRSPGRGHRSSPNSPHDLINRSGHEGENTVSQSYGGCNANNSQVAHGDNGGSPHGHFDPRGIPLVNIHNALNVQVEQSRAKSTKNCYRSKVREFMEFCKFLDPHSPLNCIVHPERVERFMTYQLYREQRKTGRTGHFDVDDYKRVCRDYISRLSSLGPDEYLDPAKPLSHQSIKQYRSAIRSLHTQQVAQHANNLSWGQVFGPSENCISISETREKRVKRANGTEKVDGAITPFHNAQQVEAVENVFWNYGCNTTNARTVFCALRNRYNFLMDLSAFLRNESVNKAELSDLCFFKYPRRADHDEMPVHLMMIHTGKTITGVSPKQYGRATRHKNVFLCPLGALGLYLMYRFHCGVDPEFGASYNPAFFLSKEYQKDWFSIKLLTDYSAGPFDNRKEMTQRSFQKSMKKVLTSLGISSAHYGHFGRCVGPVIAEFKELPPDMIKQLGKFCVVVLFTCVVY